MERYLAEHLIRFFYSTNVFFFIALWSLFLQPSMPLWRGEAMDTILTLKCWKEREWMICSRILDTCKYTFGYSFCAYDNNGSKDFSTSNPTNPTSNVDQMPCLLKTWVLDKKQTLYVKIIVLYSFMHHCYHTSFFVSKSNEVLKKAMRRSTSKCCAYVKIKPR